MAALKRVEGSLGLPTFQVLAGPALIGIVTDCGPDGAGMRWKATAPDHTRFGATSRVKIIQKLRIHAAQTGEASR